MDYKKLLYSGIVIFTASILISSLVIVWGIYSSFDALQTIKSAGIGAVESGISIALIFNILGIISAFIGMILIVIGAVKAYRQSKSES